MWGGTQIDNQVATDSAPWAGRFGLLASTAKAYTSQLSYARAVDLVNCSRSREANVLLNVSSAK